MFYVYEWYVIDTGEIFYIGKGCKRRNQSLDRRNKIFTEYVKRYDCSSRIIKRFEKENDALEFEKTKITYYKSQNQCRANLDDGGTGGTNFIWTDEMRDYKSKWNPMKDER